MQMRLESCTDFAHLLWPTMIQQRDLLERGDCFFFVCSIKFPQFPVELAFPSLCEFFISVYIMSVDGVFFGGCSPAKWLPFEIALLRGRPDLNDALRLDSMV